MSQKHGSATTQPEVACGSRDDFTKANGKCPLCWEYDIASSHQYQSHVGHHLEQLALFVLPHAEEVEEQIGEEEESQDESREMEDEKMPTDDYERDQGVLLAGSPKPNVIKEVNNSLDPQQGDDDSDLSDSHELQTITSSTLREANEVPKAVQIPLKLSNEDEDAFEGILEGKDHQDSDHLPHRVQNLIQETNEAFKAVGESLEEARRAAQLNPQSKELQEQIRQLERASQALKTQTNSLETIDYGGPEVPQTSNDEFTSTSAEFVVSPSVAEGNLTLSEMDTAQAAARDKNDTLLAENSAKQDKGKEEAATKERHELTNKSAEESMAEAAGPSKEAVGDDKDPIKFRDAIGRKFDFPWNLCANWTVRKLFLSSHYYLRTSLTIIPIEYGGSY